MKGLGQVKIAGFKSIREMESYLALGPLNVLIGENGAGKSNLLSLFNLMSAMAEGRLQEYVGREGGANALLHHGMKRTPEMRVDLEFGSERDACSCSLHLAGTANDELLLVHDSFRLPSADQEDGIDVLGIKSHQAPKKEAAGLTSTIIKNLFGQWRVYHFHDTSREAPVKLSGAIDDTRFLRGRAENLAAFLFLLKHAYLRHYEQIRDTIRLAAPFFGDFVLEPSQLNKQMILLKWRERGEDADFGAFQMSDGLLRFVCLTTLLLQPSEFLPDTLLIDEPELGLHPHALLLLAEMLRSVSRQAQVIVATQSVPLLDHLLPEPEDIGSVIVVDRREQESTFRRLKPAEFEQWLEEYSPSELWEKGVLGGSPIG
jgi:predicted ATPase